MQNGIKQQPSQRPKIIIAPHDSQVIIPTSDRVRVTTFWLQCWQITLVGYRVCILIGWVVTTTTPGAPATGTPGGGGGGGLAPD